MSMGRIRENVSKPFNGTPEFLSLAVLKGSLIARRDEIESLVGGYYCTQKNIHFHFTVRNNS